MTDPSDDRPPAVLARGVSKRFGWTWALQGMELVVDPGELVAIMGPNGAGKTTLLKILATLIQPTEGEVRISGHDPRTSTDAVRRTLGFLAPAGYLYDQLTALENLRFACLMSGVEADPSRLLAVLERVGLARAAEVQVGGFSSGMRKRLGLARLLLRPLDLVLLDEPYASLDVEGVELVDEVVEEMHAEGSTILLASHQWGRVLGVADRVVVMERGAVAWSGTPESYGELAGGPVGSAETQGRPRGA